jgi:hypothetical protein
VKSVVFSEKSPKKAMRKPLNFPRTLFICILLTQLFGLPYFIWEIPTGLNERVNTITFVDTIMMAIMLLVAVGGIIRCVVFTVIDLGRKRDG